MTSGYVPIRRGIIEHLRDGRISPTEFAVYVMIILHADRTTGIWLGGPHDIAACFAGLIGERYVRRIVERLEMGAYIKRFAKPGSHKIYPILVNRYEVTEGARKGTRLNAGATTHYDNPVYSNGEETCEETCEDNAGDGRGAYKERASGENRELRNKNSVPQGGTAIFKAATDQIFQSWKRKFGADPNWGPKDYVPLARLAKKNSFEEILRRWDLYLADSEPFIGKHGHSLALFCSRFDGYLPRPPLDIPQLEDPY